VMQRCALGLKLDLGFGGGEDLWIVISKWFAVREGLPLNLLLTVMSCFGSCVYACNDCNFPVFSLSQSFVLNPQIFLLIYFL